VRSLENACLSALDVCSLRSDVHIHVYLYLTIQNCTADMSCMCAVQVLAEYTELLSSSNNFSNYRRALHQAKNGFRIPILYDFRFVSVMYVSY